MTGQRSASRSTASKTFQGSSWLFRTDWRPFTWNYHR
jgi:hypothetical protein